MNRKEGSELKRLKAYKAELEGQLPVLKRQMKDASSAFNLAQNKVDKLEADIKALESKKELTVSDHAVLRYIERVMGINLDNIRTDIIEQVEKHYDVLGDGKYPIDNGRTVIQNGVIVTIEGK